MCDDENSWQPALPRLKLLYSQVLKQHQDVPVNQGITKNVISAFTSFSGNRSDVIIF